MHMEQQIIVYKPSQQIKLEVKTDGETVWLTQEQMGQLFGRSQSVIARHIANIFSEGELPREGFMQILHKNSFETNGIGFSQDKDAVLPVRGRPLVVYNLDVVISVGYRVKSFEGTRFRQWATRVLRQMLLRRLDEVKRIGKLENEVDALKGDVKRIEGGVTYLIEQLSTPQKPVRQRIGFGATETDRPTQPYGKL